MITEQITDDIMQGLRSSMLGSALCVMTQSEIQAVKTMIAKAITIHLTKPRSFLDARAEQMELDNLR